MGAKVRQRDRLRTLLSKSAPFQAWAGVDESGALARITWPDYPAAGELPGIVLVIGSASYSSVPGDYNWKATGQITALFFDVYDPDGLVAAAELTGVTANITAAKMAEDSRFGGLVDDVIEESLQRVADTNQRLGVISTPDVPWRRSEIGATHENPEDEINAVFSGAFWECPVLLGWGAL